MSPLPLKVCVPDHQNPPWPPPLLLHLPPPRFPPSPSFLPPPPHLSPSPPPFPSTPRFSPPPPPLPLTPSILPHVRVSQREAWCDQASHEWQLLLQCVSRSSCQPGNWCPCSHCVCTCIDQQLYSCAVSGECRPTAFCTAVFIHQTQLLNTVQLLQLFWNRLRLHL